MSKKPRAIAKSRNEKYYFSGKTCKRGHDSMRFTSNGACVECHEASKEKRKKPTKMSERKTAIAFGRKTYLGDPCPICETSRRYTKSRSCLHCETHKMNNHEAKLMIIRFPLMGGLWYAARSNKSIAVINSLLRELNIPQRSKPENYVG